MAGPPTALGVVFRSIMANTKSFFQKLLKFLASLKLAVLVIVLVAVLTAAGTIVEAKYDAMAASKWVYQTWWMWGVLGLLAVNLAAVMVDRWPWKRRHLSFLLAHIGILILLLGAVFTSKFGLDGTMRIGIGESNRFVSGPKTELTIWSSFDGDSYTKLYSREVDFFLDRPQKKSIAIPSDAGEIQILEYQPYMLASRRFVRARDLIGKAQPGAAVQFQIQNPNVNVTEWLFQGRPDEEVGVDLGPAKVSFGTVAKSVGLEGRGEIQLLPTASENELAYQIFGKDGVLQKKGKLKVGEKVATGWMGLELKVLQHLSRAEMVWDYRKLEAPTPLTTEAIRFSFQGKEHWLQMDDVMKLFTEKAVYILTYGHERLDIGFDVKLKNFEVGRYPGTMRAASYQSRVSVPGVEDYLISMNEPLKHEGLTFYQASFQDGPGGHPIASILSVNHDPGRWLKYLGSLILSIGVVVLFYDRRKAAKAAMAPKKWEENL